MKRILTLVAVVLAGCSEIKIDTVNPSGSKPAGSSGEESGVVADVKSPDIFKGRTNGYHTFRIPALTKTTKGTLIAFCEGRKNSGSDTGDINLVCRRSVDGGESWSKIITIWDDGSNTCGNPCPAVDPETGRIHLLMTWNYETDGKSAGDFNRPGSTKDTRRVFYTFSDDDGLSWETPKEITESTKLSNWGWYATGPCHGIVIKNGPKKGRILIPCDHNVIGGKGYSHVIYSDDKGKTWKIGGEVLGGNESCVEELEDGRIIITCRYSGKCRLFAYSSDYGETFSSPEQKTALVDPTCQASIIGTTRNGSQVLLHSNCANTARNRLTVKASLDNGVKWTNGFTVQEGPAAYSDLVVLDEKNVGIFYENGTSSSYEKISFKKIQVSNCL